MALSARYYLNSSNATFIDWSWRLLAFSLQGKEVELVGGGGDDWLYLGAGNRASFVDAGAGIDVLYLRGNLEEYTQSVSVEGIYTLTRMVNGAEESIKFTAGFDADVVYFKNGHITVQSELIQDSGSSLQDQNTGEFRPIVSADLISGGTPPYPLISAPPQDNTPVRIFIFDPVSIDIPALPVSGQAAIVVGGGRC